ncbi:hypothetical protein WME87_48575 [Sorangium sp. So ce1389]
MRDLYAQHTAETGQVFTEEALERAFALTAGQPRLVNALARQVVELIAVPASSPVTAEHVEEAPERLILARATHLDSLVARLHEPRIRRVIEPLLAGALSIGGDAYQDDLQYARDLGLIASDNPVRVANPIYRAVIARVLAGDVEPVILAEPRRFVLPDGRLDVARLLQEFAGFWRERGEALAGSLGYHEVAPQIVLMAFLQRVVNGGGTIDREFGLGRGRIDLLVRWPYQDAAGRREVQRTPLELKVWREGEKSPLPRGLAQLDGYLAQLGLDEGVLVVFDRRSAAGDIEERTRFEEARTPSGRRVTLLWA